eukprot:scaffold1345_cov173-Ochromonas_danica.AAC.6
MHYNPSSIALTKNTIATLAEENNIASVIVECCPIRWNRTHELLPDDNEEQEQIVAERNTQDNPLLKKLLYNEMIAANEMAEKYNIPFVLGDQLINVTTSRIRQAALDTIKDLLNPINGWQRLYNDVVSSARVAFPVGPEYLGAERNEYLAKSILVQCQLQAEALQKEEESLLLQKEVQEKREGLTVFGMDLSQWWISLFPSSKEVKEELTSSTSRSLPPKKIVAVLGMAHCNGIKQLLLNEQVKSNSD